ALARLDVLQRVLDVDAVLGRDDRRRDGGRPLPAGPAVDVGSIAGVQPDADLPNRLVERVGGEAAVVGQTQAGLLDPDLGQRLLDGGALARPVLAVFDEV